MYSISWCTFRIGCQRRAKENNRAGEVYLRTVVKADSGWLTYFNFANVLGTPAWRQWPCHCSSLLRNDWSSLFLHLKCLAEQTTCVSNSLSRQAQSVWHLKALRFWGAFRQKLESAIRIHLPVCRSKWFQKALRMIIIVFMLWMALLATVNSLNLYFCCLYFLFDNI